MIVLDIMDSSLHVSQCIINLRAAVNAAVIILVVLLEGAAPRGLVYKQTSEI